MNDSVTVAPAIGEDGWRPTEVHPLCAAFPVLSDEDLAALAEDIKRNGQAHPIMHDKDGVLLDGRMRLKACELAGLEPWLEQYDGDDPEAFVWSCNLRRDITKGQRAMVATVGFIFLKKMNGALQRGGQDTGKVELAKVTGVDPATLSKAVLVRDHRPDLVDGVRNGSHGLNDAYHHAQASKRAKATEAEKLDRVRKADRELFRRVTDREMGVDEAVAELESREKADAAQRDAVFLNLLSATRSASAFIDTTVLDKVPAWLETSEGRRNFERYFEGGGAEALEKIKAARHGLDRVELVCRGIVGKGRKR